jgi:uncharacterized protein (UPF0548 family)
VGRFENRELTYSEVGATRSETLPNGYRILRRRVLIGYGERQFQQARAALFDWRVHRGAGVSVEPLSVRCVTGVTVVLSVRILGLLLVAPCRVVWTLSESSRAGFAYGTLEGHPERGESAFTIDITDGGSVWFAITSFSTPAIWYARLGAPVTHVVQNWINSRYLRSLGSLA